jgi:hypothetical protein
MKDYTPEQKKNQPTEETITESLYIDIFKGSIEEIGVIVKCCGIG